MATYTFMTNQTVPSNATNGPTAAQVVIAGAPSRGDVTLAVNRASVLPTQASLWVQTATTPYGYTEVVPLLVMRVSPGQVRITQPLNFNLEYSQFLFARLDLIDPSQSVGATMTMVV